MKDKKNCDRNGCPYKVFDGVVTDEEDGPDIFGVLYNCSVCDKVVGIFDNDKELCYKQCSIFHTRCISNCLPQYSYKVMCHKCKPLNEDKLKKFQKQNNYQNQIKITKNDKPYVIHITKEGYETY